MRETARACATLLDPRIAAIGGGVIGELEGFDLAAPDGSIRGCLHDDPGAHMFRLTFMLTFDGEFEAQDLERHISGSG